MKNRQLMKKVLLLCGVGLIVFLTFHYGSQIGYESAMNGGTAKTTIRYDGHSNEWAVSMSCSENNSPTMYAYSLARTKLAPMPSNISYTFEGAGFETHVTEQVLLSEMSILEDIKFCHECPGFIANESIKAVIE